MSSIRKTSAFTLVELLTVVAIIAILGAVSVGVVTSGLRQARKTQEMSAAHNLLSAYLTSATSESGDFLPGYDRTVSSVTLPGGTVVSGPAAERYPWRLAPYLGDNIKGNFIVGDNVGQVDESDEYAVSCFPAFGINRYFVGGDVSAAGVVTFPDEVITRMVNSAPVLLFASAGGAGTDGNGNGTGKAMNGYSIITPPNTTTAMWSAATWTSKSAPGDYGNIDARYNNKAICAFLDGSVRMQSIDELRDMTLWSRSAAQAGNPNYMIPSAPRGGGRL